ncbi:MAG TPA: carboxypeptidase regulatory-like domain-containing protein [Candidatus Dormibacteraeota bacterium]|nr:carboxypeptidase regulatory-like domain-containing protein [Candidatus Dormibacteraeota bacterium]
MGFVRGLLLFVCLSLAVFISTPVRAQVAGATLAGTVTDAADAAVPNANVSIKNTATGVVREVTTDSVGFYSAPNLSPGVYEITAVAPGFSTYRQKDLTLTVGATVALNIPLRIGEMSQHVDVVALAPTVQLSSSAISAEVNATTVRELPLNGRDWTQLATLQPGVTSVRVEAGYSDRGNRGFGFLLSVTGHQPFENNYRINGISINDYSNGAPGSTLGVNLGTDAIQEFSVLTSNYSAEYGRASGGVINAITKPGTNDFHGDVYWFLRSKRLDARNFFDGPLPPFHRNQFGAAGGGPIIKNKTFFFADYEGIRQDKSNTFTDIVPSAAARGIGPNGQPQVAVVNGSPLPGPGDPAASPNPDPVTHIDKAVLPFLGLWPLRNDGLTTGDTGTFTTSGLERLSENYVTVRGDHHFSNNDSFAASWFYDRAPLSQPDPLLDSLTQNFTLRQMYSLEETHIFSPALVNSARFGFSRVRALIAAPLSAINPLANDPSLGSFPGRNSAALNVPGITPMLGSLGAVSNDKLTWNSFQFYDDAFYTLGNHSLKFGFAFEHMQNDELSGSGANGTFGFNSLRDFLLATPVTVTVDDPITKPVYVRQSLFGAYIQDDWHVRRNLTLNIGVRYEPVTLPTEAHNSFAVLPTLTSPAEVPVKTLWASNQTLRNFEPRIGFAWDPFSNGKTAVRGGFGIFDVLPIPWVFTHGSTSTLPFGRLAGASNLSKGDFPHVPAKFINFDPTAVANRYVEQNPHRNYVMNWNLNIQRELSPNVVAMVAYVGMHNVHQAFSTDDSNMVIPTLTPIGYLWPIPHMDPNPTGTNGNCAGTTTPPPCDWPRMNPNVGPIRLLTWGSSSYYEGFQAMLLKRMSHGFQAQGSYTWGKCIDMGSGSLLGDPYKNSLSSLMFFNRNSRRGLCDFNVAHNFVGNFVWTLPTPEFGGAVGHYILGGWELGGILSANTGTPMTLVVAGDPLGQGSSDPWPYPNRVPGAACKNPVNSGSVNYLKLDCFGPPTAPASYDVLCVKALDTSHNPIPGTCMNLFGNNGRTSVIGPGLIDLDFSVFKNFRVEKISDSFNVQFRAEFFNIMNHTNFQPPLDNKVILYSDGSQIGSPAGQITATSTTSRQIQLGLKLIW